MHCINVTINSAQTVPIAAPSEPSFGIKMAFNVIFVIAPAMYE